MTYHRCVPMRLRWFVAMILLCGAWSSAQNISAPGSALPTFGTTVVVPGGLHGNVYFIPKDTTVLPDFESGPVQRVGEIWTETLNIVPRHWRVGFPGLTDRFEWFAVDYNGNFWVDKPGRYTFALLSDDGSRMFIDDIPMIDNDCQHPPDLRVAALKLEGGGHKIRVSYFQGPRDCLALLLAIAGPDQKWRIFSTRDFRPPSNPEDWKYSANSSSTLVSTVPAEASMTMFGLFQRLIATDPSEKIAIESVRHSGCTYGAVRICGK